jgi:hypothetical protein
VAEDTPEKLKVAAIAEILDGERMAHRVEGSPHAGNLKAVAELF